MQHSETSENNADLLTNLSQYKSIVTTKIEDVSKEIQ